MGTSGKRTAIVVGVSNYEKAEVPNLVFTNKDARRLASVLMEFCDFAPDNVHLFCDDKHDDSTLKWGAPTRSDVLAKTEAVCKTASDNDLVLFFFAGHGNELSREAYLFTNDTRRNVVDATAIRVRDINGYLEESRARCKIRIFDACRASFGARDVGFGTMKRGFSDALLQTPKGSATLSACSSDESAWEDPNVGQGIFTYYLCEGLSGAANPKGNVTLERLMEYLSLMLADWAKLHSRKQTPQYTCQIEGPFILTRARHTTDDPVGAPSVQGALASLYSFYERRMGEAPDDLRSAQSTLNHDMHEIGSVASECFVKPLSGFSHPNVGLTVLAEGVPLGGIDGTLWQRLAADMDKARWREEYVDNVAFVCSLEPTTMILATVHLALAVVRFTFAYWVWSAHLFVSAKHLKGWRPNPPILTDFRFVPPDAVLDTAKMSEAMEWVFANTASVQSRWSEELTQHLNERFESIRGFRDENE